MATEFELIRRYFSRPTPSAVLGAGDDCALLRPSLGMQLAVSTDMLVEGRHFPPGTDARRLGHKSLAVNLSDLAAMGADARWMLLAIALPQPDEGWIAAFADGLYALADSVGAELVGGDTTRGPLCISITVLGELPVGLALRRDGANAGDDVWLSGSTGDAALGLAHLQKRIELSAPAAANCIDRLELPQARLELGGRLRGIASAAIDISDGLLADLGHVLESSGVAARVELAKLPRSEALRSCGNAALAEECLLAGGDDYELLFSAPAASRGDVAAIGRDIGVSLTRIGEILVGKPRAQVVREDGSVLAFTRGGFDHFAPA